MLDIGYSPVWARREEEGQWNVKWSWLGDFSGSYWPVPVSFLSAPVLSGPHSNSLTVYCSALEPWRKLQDQSERSLWIQKGEMHACMKPEYLKKIKLFYICSLPDSIYSINQLHRYRIKREWLWYRKPKMEAKKEKKNENEKKKISELCRHPSESHYWKLWYMDKQQHHDLGLVRNVESWTLHTSKAFFFLFQNLVLEVSHREFEKKKKFLGLLNH